MEPIFLPRIPEGMELAKEVFRLEHDDCVNEILTHAGYKMAHQKAFAGLMLALVADEVLPKFVSISEMENTQQSQNHVEFKYQGKHYHIEKGQYKNLDKAFADAQVLAETHNAFVEDLKTRIAKDKQELGQRIIRHLKIVYPEQYADIPSGRLHLDFELGGFVKVTKMEDEDQGKVLNLYNKLKNKFDNLRQ